MQDSENDLSEETINNLAVYKMFSLMAIKLLVNKYIKAKDIKNYNLMDYILMLHDFSITSYNQQVIDKFEGTEDVG